MSDNDALAMVFGGYDRSEVDTALNQLRADVEALRSANEALRNEIDGTESQLVTERARSVELHSKLDRLPEKVSYSVLGPQFEEVLHLAEEKSGRLVTDARAEAEKIRKNAQSRSAELTRDAQQRANEIIRDAELRTTEMRENSEKSAAELVMQANMRLAQATERVAEARREADEIVSSAQAKIEESQLRFRTEVELEDAALADLADRTAKERLQMEENLRLRQEQFERDSTLRQQEASELSSRLLSEAQLKAGEISDSAREINEESDSLRGASQQRADEILAEARRIAGGVLDQAQSLADQISELTRDYSDGLVARSSGRTDLLREERDAVESFVTDITDTRVTDRLLSVLEREINPADFLAAERTFDFQGDDTNDEDRQD